MTEDAVQDVLMASHEKRHTYDPAHPFRPWLIAWHKWIDRLPSLKAEASEPLEGNVGVPYHGDAVVAGSTFKQLLAKPKPRRPRQFDSLNSRAKLSKKPHERLVSQSHWSRSISIAASSVSPALARRPTMRNDGNAAPHLTGRPAVPSHFRLSPVTA
jgi:hypothetical protein